MGEEGVKQEKQWSAGQQEERMLRNWAEQDKTSPVSPAKGEGPLIKIYWGKARPPGGRVSEEGLELGEGWQASGTCSLVSLHVTIAMADS